MLISSAEFRKTVGQFAAGVTVVTTRAPDGRPQGLTVSSFCSVSLEPPLVLVCVDHRSETHAGFKASGVFGVSILEESQEDLSRRFATAGEDKFHGIELITGRSGVALIPGALAHLECRIVKAPDAGDHTVYIGEVTSLGMWPGRPLLYHASAYHRLTPAESGPLAGNRWRIET